MGDVPGAGELVMAYVATQVGVLRGGRGAVLADEPDAVHKGRVATRRLRSTLRTFGELFTPGVAAPLRSELRWLGEALGAPRDAEVLRERLLEEVADLPVADRDLIGPRIAAALAGSHALAHAELVRAMGERRYERLSDELQLLVDRPRLQPSAIGGAEEVLHGMQLRAVRRVARIAAHAAARPSDLTRWHEVRKAAKAVRYGAELLLPVGGDQAVRARDAWEAVTELFGTVQDAVVAQGVIGELSWAAVAEGLPRLPFDDLRHRQDAILRRALQEGRAALATALALGWPGPVPARASLV